MTKIKLAIVCATFPMVTLAGEFEDRRDTLHEAVAEPWFQDPCAAVESDLDRRPFSQLNDLEGPRILDGTGWSVEARIGGRPFLCFDRIRRNGELWPFDGSGFELSSSGISQAEIDAHFALGKTVNRLWLTHPASNGSPIVMVLTPDGFINVGGATAPRLQGAATRLGFIGEPFGVNDYLQHVDRLDLVEVDDDILLLVFDVHSEAGEGVIEIELKWNRVTEEPEISIRSALLARFPARLGFAGVNFLRGPTLFGLLEQAGSPERGIEAFHDGRSVFLEPPGGTVVRELLVPPVAPGVVVRRELLASVPKDSRLIMDQPQNVRAYFSKTPAVHYEHRTDLVLTLKDTTVGEVSLQRFQTAVDLDDANPEANESANVFFAADLTTQAIESFEIDLHLAAADFETLMPEPEQGLVFVSDRAWSEQSLYFLPLDEELRAAGDARPLTDGVILHPRRPSASADGRFIIFDADKSRTSTARRIYIFDRLRGAVRKVSTDPFGAPNDLAASFNGDGTQFSLISNRSGLSRVLLEEVATGLPGGYGNSLARASDADWSHAREEIVLAMGSELQLLDVASSTVDTELTLPAGQIPRSPKFSPDGERIAYAAADGIFVLRRDGSELRQILDDGDHPTWVDDDHLVVHRAVEGELDLFLVEVSSSQIERLTVQDGVNESEPEFLVVPTFSACPGESAHCLNRDRFRVAVQWRDFTGATGSGKLVPFGSDDSGLFWFFDPDNWEMLVKVLDGCALNQHFWVFAAATTNVEYRIEVTDRRTGDVRSYFNPLGQAARTITDTRAFTSCSKSSIARDFGGSGEIGAAWRISNRISAIGSLSEGDCDSSPTAICLNRERFQVEIDWSTAGGEAGSGQLVPFRSDDSGLFWFFEPDNWEVLVKVLDGCALNQHYWVFAAATTDVAFTLRILDSQTGAQVEYVNPQGLAASAVADTAALSTCP